MGGEGGEDHGLGTPVSSPETHKRVERGAERRVRGTVSEGSFHFRCLLPQVWQRQPHLPGRRPTARTALRLARLCLATHGPFPCFTPAVRKSPPSVTPFPAGSQHPCKVGNGPRSPRFMCNQCAHFQCCPTQCLSLGLFFFSFSYFLYEVSFFFFF